VPEEDNRVGAGEPRAQPQKARNVSRWAVALILIGVIASAVWSGVLVWLIYAVLDLLI
jgi:hypothetical protein